MAPRYSTPVAKGPFASACALLLLASFSQLGASSWQVDEQQSPFAVLLSSHCSEPIRRPSPQMGAQVLGEPAQPYPASTVQTEEQPSPFTRLLSSQASGPVFRPSPQIALHTVGEPPLQLKPAS